MNIVAKFDDLEPFEKQMNVYYKGFKIGKTTKIYPDKDYENTFINITLHQSDINLPENITAKIVKRRLGNYVNLITPDSPSIKRVKENSVIQGIATKDIDSILHESLNEDGLDEIIEDATGLMETATVTVKNAGDVFAQVNGIIIDIRGDIKKMASNLEKTTRNLENLTANLNESLGKIEMENSVKNIEQSTQNIKEITQNIDEITYQIDKTTVPIINSALCDTKEITNGIKCTLKKRMGIGRLFFGKPIQNCND